VESTREYLTDIRGRDEARHMAEPQAGGIHHARRDLSVFLFAAYFKIRRQGPQQATVQRAYNALW
jgi:hypothetical protein